MMKALRKLAVVLSIVIASVAISIPACAQKTSQRVLNLQTLYSYLVYPNNQQVFPSSGVSPVDALFSATGAQGRIAPLGEGHDIPTVKKIFFGLSPTNQTTSTSYITGVTFRSITEQPPLVIVEVDVSFAITPLGQELGLTEPYQLRETGQFTFSNKGDHIVSFDLLMPYLDTAMAIAGSDFSNPAFVSEAISNICNVAQASCTQANTGYAGLTDCETYLSSIPAGTWNRGVNQNTVVCRAFDLPFVSINPAGECPVIGRTGGTQCLDSNIYQTYFSETF